MYNYKVEESLEHRKEFKGNLFLLIPSEILREYRSGALDPGRQETKYEMVLQKKKKAQMLKIRKKLKENSLYKFDLNLL